MDSGDEAYEASDVESIGDFYSDTGSMDDDDDTPQQQRQKYRSLSEVDISFRQDEDITKISTVLSLSRSWSSILLCHYNWSVNEVHEEWFADEEKVRKAVGLLEKAVIEIPENIKEISCGICLENHHLDGMASPVCGHLFCVGCWSSYINTSIINDGIGCLMLRCPDPSCTAAIDQDMINRLASEEDKEKYSGFFVRSYVEWNKKIKWCPAPGCGYAVELVVRSNESYDVTCRCSYSFCWNCSEETHRPVDCSAVARWILKNNVETEENTNWIIAYTKSCPKCKRPIEKDLGCMHMTCRVPCKFEFCWLCLAAWSGHGRACNSFAVASNDETERIQKKAKMAVEKYTHYYERWASNQSSRQKALADLHQMQTTQIETLTAKQSVNVLQLGFIIEAWLQIIECRRVLKWTYAYGYYLPEDEAAKKQFFEYLQGQAEWGLERLHYCAEKELNVYLVCEGRIPGFDEFREKLVRLTDVTRTYFENLVKALENGLSDVHSHGDCSKEGT
ncbi:hypothetical protein NE237_007638 [Protea cynaroides]|uniref:RBR-type E3 ubiquitin transferase n=1 Tax=Protea cynaroides TaxID=273540 RepID=A0A9Q0KPV7_9MAGN|nr:hypothetical protein NE237_007638 [Protea cynaroides]